MKKLFKLVVMVITMTALFGGAKVYASSEDSVSSAYYLCAVFDQTGLASKPCEVSGWSSTVSVVIDMNSAEARKLCKQIAGLMVSKGRSFDAGWELKIFSPYSGKNTIAYCKL